MNSARLFLIFMMVLPWRLMGQANRLSFVDCLDRALEQSFILHSQEENVRASRSLQQVVESGYYPQLFGGVEHDQLYFAFHNYRQQFMLATVEWSPGDWLKKTALAAAKETEARQAEKQQTALDVLRRVSALYLGLLRNREELRLLDLRARNLEDHRQVAEALWQGGVRTELDVLQTLSEINGVFERKAALQAETDNVQTALLQLLQMAPPDTLLLQDFSEDVVNVQPDSGVTLAQNPSLRALEMQAQAGQLRLREVQAQRWPHLQLRGGYVVDRDPTAEGNYWQAGIGLQVPLFRWGETRFREQGLEAEVQALRWQRSQAQRELEIRAEQIRRQLAGLRASYHLQQQRLEITRQSLLIATANYQAGQITNLEFLDAQEASVAAEVSIRGTVLLYAMNLIENFALTNQPEKIKLLQGAP